MNEENKANKIINVYLRTRQINKLDKMDLLSWQYGSLDNWKIKINGLELNQYFLFESKGMLVIT